MNEKTTSSNKHPAVMFEIMAADQAGLTGFYKAVFGWEIQPGTGGFGYVHFPSEARPLLGGIGQAQPGVAGYEKGIVFYFMVRSAAETLELVTANGGSVVVHPTPVDGYTFANFRDPEGNLLGLIEPFKN
jgi:uncharacterized protein